MSMVLVELFNETVLQIPRRPIGMMNAEEFKLSLHQLREEIDEIEEAFEKGDLVGVVDGLIDLDYFQKGVVYKHGINKNLYYNMFRVVHEANMAKVKGTKETRQGYGESADAIKPEGWTPPEETLAKMLGLDK